MDGNSRTTLMTAIVVALQGVSAAAAQAATVPRWFSGWGAVASPLPISTYGSAGITFKLSSPSTSVLCHVSAAGTIVDPHEAAGIGEISSFKLSKCKPPNAGCAGAQVEVLAGGLPWPSHLAYQPPFRDIIEGAQLSFRCGGAMSIGTFSGTLSPVVNDQEHTSSRCVPTKKPPCGRLEFEGEALSGIGGTVTLTGIDKIEGHGGAFTKPLEVKLVTF